MEQELEIEYKSLLTEKEYHKILLDEFSEIQEGDDYQKLTQTNYYFDTLDKNLKKQGAALRIRILNSRSELTFKVPKGEFLMETNFNLSPIQTKRILKKGSFNLVQLTQREVELNLENINLESTFIHFNTFSTIRYEKKNNQNLLVLDQSFFQNNNTDYELEVEGENSKDARNYFHSILNNYSIPFRPSLPKIARAEKNK